MSFWRGFRIGVLSAANLLLLVFLLISLFESASKPAREWCETHSNFSFVVDYFGFKYRGDSSNWVDREILRHGAFELPVLSFMERALDTLGLKGKARVLDVGAYSGTHSLFLSQFAKQVYAFEPSQASRQRILRAIAENEIDNIQVFPEALGEKKENLLLYDSEEGGSLVASVYEDFSSSNTHSRQVKIVRGDDKLRDIGAGNIHLIKIDVEGFERGVLRGLRETMLHSRPLIVVELTVGKESSFRTIEDLASVFPANYRFLYFSSYIYLPSEDFSLTMLTDRQLSPDSFSGSRVARQRQVVAVPDEFAALISSE